MSRDTIKLEFKSGTIVADGALPDAVAAWFAADPRAGIFRARACDYPAIAMAARAAGVKIDDTVCDFPHVEFNFIKTFTPLPHQSAAYLAWKRNGFRGIAALPTGSGKTFLAMMAIRKLQRSAIVLVPTIDLLEQWAALLKNFFGCEVGMLGGGEHSVRPLTVSTYDSAVLHMEFVGNRFALLICDECHHLPGQLYRTAAEQCVAPYRLGLSATPEDDDPERFAVLTGLLGEVVADVGVTELEGKVLAPYIVRSIKTELTADERSEYEQCRQTYRGFATYAGIDFSRRNAWRDFIFAASRTPEGRDALRAYLRQRELSRRSRNKLAAVWELLRRHRGERMLIFTADNATAYALGREFLLPVLTHHTRPAERRDMLDKLRSGVCDVLVTSKVLNEGVDVPEAAVGIVVSGSGSVREHVQRLGRILRSRPGKQAVLYELVSSDTAEEYVMRRRRQHDAYRGKTR